MLKLPRALRKKLTLRRLKLRFNNDWAAFRSIAASQPSRFEISDNNLNPQLYDRTRETAIDRHYFFHPAWAMRILMKIRPLIHTDISSIAGFSALASAVFPVRFFDYRKIRARLANFTSGSADLLALPFKSGSIKSLSCMHTVEHIGLGRYGDTLDPEGDLKAINELVRVLAPGGNLLFVVPVGKARLLFNAHRIYSFEQIMSYFKPLQCLEATLVPDNERDGDLVVNPDKGLFDKQDYGCGCFWFKKN